MKVRLFSLVVLVGLMLALTGCGGAPGISRAPTATNAATSTPRPSPTTQAKVKPSPTPKPDKPEPTATVEASEPAGDMAEYVFPDGRFRLSYPDGWEVLENPAGVIIEEPNQEVFVRVLFYRLSAELPNETLVDITNEQLLEEHGELYVDDGITPQRDGSIRLDYSIKPESGAPARSGQVFIEQSNSTAYELQVEVDEDLHESYIDRIEAIIDSYRISKDAPPPDSLTPTEEATEEPGDQPAGVEFETYTHSEGNYSIEYPADWTQNEVEPNVQFLSPNGEALVQVTYSDLGAALPHDQLIEIAAEALASGFGDDYEELERVEQSDGSTRVDFRVNQDPALVGSAFIEQRGTGLYMLMVMVHEEVRADYDEIFEYVVDSYQTPR